MTKLQIFYRVMLHHCIIDTGEIKNQIEIGIYSLLHVYHRKIIMSFHFRFLRILISSSCLPQNASVY